MGERCVSALSALAPEFSRVGSKSLPRTQRSLKGWRSLCPGHSRRPVPWAAWCAVMAEMVRRGSLDMAMFVLLSLEAYLRPSEALSLIFANLMPGTAQGVQSWVLLPASISERVGHHIEDRYQRRQHSAGQWSHTVVGQDPQGMESGWPAKRAPVRLSLWQALFGTQGGGQGPELAASALPAKAQRSKRRSSHQREDTRQPPKKRPMGKIKKCEEIREGREA